MLDAPRVVVSLHDVHPGSRAAFAGVLPLLQSAGVGRVTLLVVPRWHGGPLCTEDVGFAAWLRGAVDAGHEVCLHGYVHCAGEISGGPWQRLVGRHYTRGEGEFYRIRYQEAAARVQAGLALLTETLGLPVVGFTPPAWLLSAEARCALVSAGLRYATTWGGVDLLQRGRLMRAPTLAWSSRSAERRLASCVWNPAWSRWQRRAPVLRIAIHPGDLRYPVVAASLLRNVGAALAAGRAPVTYRDLVLHTDGATHA